MRHLPAWERRREAAISDLLAKIVDADRHQWRT
jgi:hypothetical protein